MKCPSCQWEQAEGRLDCERCGLVFEKWKSRQAGSDLAPLPETLTLKTATSTHFTPIGYFVRWGIVLVLLASVGFLPSLLKTADPNSMLMVACAIIGLIVLIIAFRIAARVPRTVAVLDQEGIRFADSVWMVLHIVKWNQASWGQVASVEAVGKSKKNGIILCRTIQITVPGDSGKPKTFGLHLDHPQIEDFVQFLAAKVSPSKMDPSLPDILKAENLDHVRNKAALGKRWGLSFAVFIILSGFVPRMLGVDFQTRIYIRLGMALLAAILGYFLSLKRHSH